MEWIWILAAVVLSLVSIVQLERHLAEEFDDDE